MQITRKTHSENQTGKPKKVGTVLTETPRPKIIPPDIVDKLLKSIKESHSGPEYLLAWLVCRVGLTLKKAHELNLAQIQINDDGWHGHSSGALNS
ncbi:hypothetical protein BMETH_1223_0 [methanotrophic bacterial endosymbiont of Bathymodiolus sp.]|nr:hypothetical protein BMETH_1223_0 [methanotrophic bacterial endosymbiont of Bathymodiolus sp.]